MSLTATYKELWRAKGSGREEEIEIRCKMSYCRHKRNVTRVVGTVFRVRYGISILRSPRYLTPKL